MGNASPNHVSRDADAEAQRQRWRERKARSTKHTTVDSEPVRKHVADLIGQGFSAALIADTTDLSRSAVGNLVSGKNPRCAIATAEAVMALDARTLFASASDSTRVPSYGVRRRYEALVSLGWRAEDMDEVAEMLDIKPLGKIARRTIERGHTFGSTHRGFDALYRRMWGSSGPSQRNRKYAHFHDWAPPGAWADIDDPSEHPLPEWAEEGA
jgi:hypothetical protein